MARPLSFLAIDLGAASGRAMLGALDNGRLTLSELHRFENGPVSLPDGLHWDFLRLWSEVQRALALAAHSSLPPVTIGIDTWGVDYALLDRRGALLGNPYHYRDGRTDGMMAEAFRRMPREQIFELTGIQFLPLNTLYQLLSQVVSEDPALDVAETLLMLPDLLNYWLSGRISCEFTNATTTQCYDPRAGNWSGPLLQAMGIPARIFPQVIKPGTVLGPLCAPVAEETGARELQVIAPGTHDTGSAVAAVPAEGQNFAWISSGTWSIMGALVDAPVITPASLAHNFTNEGGVDGTFRFSKNVAGLWFVQECRRTWRQQGEDLSYDELGSLAAAAAPLVSLIDPDAAEFLKPGDIPARMGAYCARTGQPVPESKGALLRCALESVALRYRWVLDRLDELLGRRLEPVHIVGGGTRNRLLCQFTADATGRTVVAGPAEATAIGNILVQAIAYGAIESPAAAREVVRQSFSVEVFSPGDRAGWEPAYRRFSELLP